MTTDAENDSGKSAPRNRHTFDYRLMDHHKDGDETCIGIHEVYYEDGRPMSFTDEPVRVFGSTVADIRETLDRMRRACDLPALKPSDFPSG